jgi:glutaminyl-tRNA synthetase
METTASEKDMKLEGKPLHFIQEIIEEDNRNGKHGGRVHTRFPPEPNGYLHIGHAKSICLNFGLAQQYNGKCNLRFDDTNPEKEDVEYVESIMEDVKWLGFDWEDRLYYASDYFENLYEFALKLIKDGKAYVCHQTAEEMAASRGTITVPGTDSPYRNRSVEENLELFTAMRADKFPDNHCTLRAKIDMAHPNMNMRDPVMYRIRHAEHHRTGNKWCIYPLYDFTHGLSDALEGITHSICTLEFEIRRPLYDWFVHNVMEHHPQQIEFARLNLSYTLMSKRHLLKLVKENYVSGWDDPRMPTICGLRRRGYTPESLRNFAERIGIAKKDNVIQMELLEFCVREHLNKVATRVMAVLNPVKVVITNYPEGQIEEMQGINNPEDESAGKRSVPFSRELYIEREDFMEIPPKGYFRMTPGNEVRLRYGYVVRCVEAIKDAEGNITEIHCTYDPETKGGNTPDGRKIKGTIHWVSAAKALEAEVRLYDKLFTVEDPSPTEEEPFRYLNYINPESCLVKKAFVEPFVLSAKPGERFQFERTAYFCVDKNSTPENLIFNRTVTLKDSFTKTMK